MTQVDLIGYRDHCGLVSIGRFEIARKNYGGIKVPKDHVLVALEHGGLPFWSELRKGDAVYLLTENQARNFDIDSPQEYKSFLVVDAVGPQDPVLDAPKMLYLNPRQRASFISSRGDLVWMVREENVRFLMPFVKGRGHHSVL